MSEREFWMQVRRGLLLIVRAIEKRFAAPVAADSD